MTELADFPSVTHLLRQRVYEHAEQEAVIFVRSFDACDGTVTISYGQLDAQARLVAAWLQAHCRPADRVLLVYPVGIDFVVGFLGCVYAGMIAVPAPLPGQYQHQQRRLQAIARDAGVAAVFTDIANLPAVTAWASGAALDHIPCLATDGPAIPEGGMQVLPVVDRQTLLLLQYTSGSTGEPKGVMVSHHNLLHNVDSFRRGLGLSKATRFGGWIPLYHDMGLMAQLLPALLLGSSSVLMTPNTFVMRPIQWLRMIDKYNIHFSAAPNFAYELCTRRITDEQLAGIDLSRWNFAANGSEPVHAATLHAFARRFAAAGFCSEAICPCYGMAEATVYISGRGRRRPVVRAADAALIEQHRFRDSAPGQPTRELVSCGAANDYDVRIVDPETSVVLPEGHGGEIWLRGDSVARGYWNNAPATTAAFAACTDDGQSGFLRTGDRGFLLDGEIYITGRIKEMLIVHGRNLYPQDIEYEIRSHHSELAGRCGAVFTVSTAEYEEAAVITHEVRGTGSAEQLELLARSIKATAARELGLRVSGVVLLRPGSVQRTTSGKIQRTAMRELFLRGRLDSLHEELDAQVQDARQLAATLRDTMSAGNGGLLL